MINVTEIALTKIKEISESEDIGHFDIRIKVKGGGCAGFTYDMYYEDIISDLDEVFPMGDVKIVIDPLSLQYMDGITIDFGEGPLSSGFKFINPNVKSTCGCGSSFSV